MKQEIEYVSGGGLVRSAHRPPVPYRRTLIGPPSHNDTPC